MGCSSREEIVEVLDAFDGVLDRLCELSLDALTTPELLRMLQRLERGARRQRTPQHALINQLDAQAGEEELGGTLSFGAGRPATHHQGRSQPAYRRGRRSWAGRQALTGEPLAPLLTQTAAAQRDGLIGRRALVKDKIRKFFADLPAQVDLGTREAVEPRAGQQGSRGIAPTSSPNKPSNSMDWLPPRRRNSATKNAPANAASYWASRNSTGSPARAAGWSPPTWRAAHRGRAGQTGRPRRLQPRETKHPSSTKTPDEDAVRRDHRSAAQRNHDGFLAGMRAMLASGELGQHHGLPVTVIITATLQDLQPATGSPHRRRHPAAHGRRDPDGHPRQPLPAPARRGAELPLWLGRTQRTRLPRTTNRAPRHGTWMHLPRLRRARLPHRSPPRHPRLGTTRLTNIDDLTLACGPDNRLVDHRLDHPQKRQRRHRMATATPSRLRSTPHQHLPPPRQTPRTRRRRTRMTVPTYRRQWVNRERVNAPTAPTAIAVNA